MPSVPGRLTCRVTASHGATGSALASSPRELVLVTVCRTGPCATLSSHAHLLSNIEKLTLPTGLWALCSLSGAQPAGGGPEIWSVSWKPPLERAHRIASGCRLFQVAASPHSGRWTTLRPRSSQAEARGFTTRRARGPGPDSSDLARLVGPGPVNSGRLGCGPSESCGPWNLNTGRLAQWQTSVHSGWQCALHTLAACQSR
jgi:hypothetical protein